jgi:predicted secreted Zn-dependent protease
MNRKIFTLIGLFSASLTVTYLNIPTLATPLVNHQPLKVSLQLRPNITIRTVYYEIKGLTFEALRTQMNTLGPLDAREKRHYDGRTDWFVRWNFRYKKNGNICKITTANVDTSVIFTLPQWRKPPQVDSNLVNSWNKFITNLQIHEDGHKQHGIDAGNEVLPTILNMPVYQSCEQLASDTNRLIVLLKSIINWIFFMIKKLSMV